MKKKLMGLGLTMAMVISLTACGGGNSDNNASPAQDTSAPETTTSAPEATTEAPEVIAPFETDLQSGAYYVGLNIPEGIYNVTVNSGLGNIMTTSGVSSALGSGTAVEYADSFNNLTLANGDILTVTQSLDIKISTDEAYYSSMSSYENPATEEYEFDPGNYVVGTDVAAGIYDIEIVSGTANVNTDDYSFSTMLTDDDIISESAANSFKNAELLEGQTLVITSGTVKLTPSPDMSPLTPAK